MLKILVAVPKGRPFLNGFTHSLLNVLEFEQNAGVMFRLKIMENEYVKGKGKYKRIGDIREELVDYAIAGNFDYIWFLDDDMTFPKSTLSRLLESCQDFVSGIAFVKKPPHTPTCLIARPYRTKDGGFGEKYHPLANYPATTFEVDATGLFCALIRVDALRKLKKPYFINKTASKEGVLGEDVAFCRNLWEVGVKMYCNPFVKCGHLTDEGGSVIEADYLKYYEKVISGGIKI